MTPCTMTPLVLSRVKEDRCDHQRKAKCFPAVMGVAVQLPVPSVELYRISNVVLPLRMRNEVCMIAAPHLEQFKTQTSFTDTYTKSNWLDSC